MWTLRWKVERKLQRLGKTLFAIPSLLLLVGMAAQSTATTLVERDWDGTSSFLASYGIEPSGVYAPFESLSEGEQIRQIVWWGSASSLEFSISFHDAEPTSTGLFRPYSSGTMATAEFSVTANRIPLNQFTDLFWVNLSDPVSLSSGVHFLSIVGEHFLWGTSATPLPMPFVTYVYKYTPPIVQTIPLDYSVAFRLNDSIEPIPEPTTALLLLSGLAGLAFGRPLSNPRA